MPTPAKEPVPARAPRAPPAPRRLARGLARVLWTWLGPGRRFPPTREGWYFLGATLLVGLVTINGGMNPLFLMWGMMLFLILASGVLSELCLRGLEVRRAMPPSVHAETPYLMGIALTNGKLRLPSFSVEVEDLVDGRPIEKRCYFLKLPAGRMQETAYRHVAPRRGRLRLSGFRVSTRFPFGLIHKSRDVAAAAELLVYPALCPVPAELLRGFASHHGRGDHKWRSRRGEIFGLREFRQGDDPRDIHWRTSAHRGGLFLRENEDDEGQEVCLILDNGDADAGADADAGGTGTANRNGTSAGTGDAGAARLQSAEPGRSSSPAPSRQRARSISGQHAAAFEETVSLAASLACELLRLGYRVGLAARGERITPEGGQAQATRLLRFLALVQPASASMPLRESGRTGARIRLRPGHAPVVGFGESSAAPRRIA